MRFPVLLAFLALLLLSVAEASAQSHVRVYAVALANDSAGQFMGASSNGSGLYQSDDTGKTWRHLGWQNIKAYSMDLVRSSNGRILYLATGLGVLKSEDFGGHWKQVTDWRVREVMDVAVNQRDGREVWIATAFGPWRSNDSGVTWQPIATGLSTKYCSRIAFDTTDYNSLILASEDGAYTLRQWQDVSELYWKQVRGIDRPIRAIAQSRNGWNVEGDGISARVSYDSTTVVKHRNAIRWTVSIDPSRADPFFVFGGPNGADWHRGAHSEDIDVKNVASSALVAPEMLLGTLGKGVYLRSTNTYTLDGRQIWTLRTALVEGPSDGTQGVPDSALRVALSPSGALHSEPAPQDSKRMKWLDAVAGQTYHHPDFAVITARLNLHRDTAFAYQQLDTLLSRSYGDMFWAMWTAGTYYATQDVLRPEYKRKIRDAWKRLTPYRGDTENHFLMYYAAWFLMSQAFSDETGSEWFNGRSSRENYEDARDYLVHWTDETARYGLTEWDSPRYGYYYITPLVLLSEYTQDPQLKARFKKTLDLVLTDYALEYLNGSYCGAHSRVSDEQALDARHNEISAYGSYFFGDSVANLLPDVAFAALTHYECPKIIRDIALDRSKPHEVFERRRSRPTIRHSVLPYEPVYKYTYMTDKFCLGSMQGGIVQPIQQQSWSLVFNQDSTPNVFTGLNPHVDSVELTKFFPEYPEFMMERIGAVKQGYPNENKWVGGSPYEHIYQDKNLLIATYDLPDSARYHHVDLFIPATLRLFDTSSFQQPDWVVFTTDNLVRVGIHPSAPFRMTHEVNGVRIRMNAGHSGYAVYCEDGSRIDIARLYRKLRSLDLRPKQYPEPLAKKQGADTWLYKSPYVTSRFGSGVISLAHGKDKLVLDFTK